jgi:hypothetical protein
MSARIFCILILAMLPAFAATVVAQDADANAGNNLPVGNVPAGQAAPVDDLQARVDGLVGELSSPLFPKRQKAVTQLLQLDAPAVALLEAKLEDAPEAVAVQLRQVISNLRKRLFDNRLIGLNKTDDPAKLVGMPDWERFVAIAGSAEDALPVYLEMLEAEKALFADRMFSSSELSDHLEQRSIELQAACNGQLDEEYPVASAVALMVIASDETVTLRRGTSTNISESLEEARFEKLITDGFHAKMLRAVTSEWLKRPGIAVDRPLLLCMKYQLPVGREIALRTLERPVFNQGAVYSLLYLGALQQTDALPVIEQVMNNDAATRPFWPPRGQTVEELSPGRVIKSTYSAQVRDVALAVAIHLRDESHKAFGMEISTSEQHLFTFNSMGFNDDADRNAAFSKYRAAYPSP